MKPLFAVFGMGLSRELYRRRVVDKMRLAFFSWLYDNPDEDEAGEEKLEEKFREPVQLQELEGTPMPGSEEENNSGILKELLSPDWALTPNLHIALVTLPYGAKLDAIKSEGVEFYYVIEGEGAYTHYLIGEEPKDSRISSGIGFLVDPGTCRGFTAKGRGQLVLLRATDSGIVEGYDVQTNTLSSSRAIVSAGLGKIEEMVKKYSQSEDYEVLKTSGN
jgi:mannose-6-phosphate isomerase-like protein (cupin superfamily)